MNRRGQSEDGAILVIAVLVVTVIALVTGFVLSKASGNFMATVGLRQVAATNVAADAAAKIAIGDLQQGESANDPGASYPSVGSGQKWVYDNYADGSGCFGLTGSNPRTSIELKNVAPPAGSVSTSTSARVECTPVLGTGIFGSGQGVPITTNNSPARALTLLGDGSVNGDGLTLKPLGSGNNNEFVVAGGLATNANISVSNGGLFSNSSIWARTGCSGTITSTPAAVCNHAAVPDPLASTPANVTTVPAYQPIPSGCTFSPGYYDDSVALTTKTSSCAKAVFTPGTYYFDFHNNDSGNDPTVNAADSAAVPSGNDTWNITNTVIGGTTTSDTTSPGQCVSPIDSNTAQGVQFIFGGDSRMTLGGNATVELCGTYGSNPPIVIYGLNTSDVSAPLSSPPAITASTATATGFTVTPVTVPATSLTTALANVGGAQATWSTLAGTLTGTITMDGFTPGSTIPAGSMLKSATLAITHQDQASGKGNSITPSLTIKIGSGTETNTTNQPVVKAAMATDNVDITSDLAQAVHDGNLANVELAFKEAAKGVTSSAVDAVQLTLTYFPPHLRAQTTSAIPGNCIPTGGCDFLSDGNNSGDVFMVNGVTYDQYGTINLNPGNGGGLIAFRYGLVARGLNMKGQPQYTFGYPVVSIPQQGPGFGSNVTAVDLKVYLCVGQSTCATGGTLSLTSRVMITDLTNSVPVPGKRQINVLSWSEQR